MPVGLYSGAQVSTGNGVTTVFPYGWKVLDQTHIQVKIDGVLKVLGTDYTVDGVGASTGGNITMLVAPAVGALMQRARVVPYVRTGDYQTNGDLKADTLDNDLDLEEMQLQQIVADALRSFKAPLSVTADQVLTDAQWAARASMFLGFDGSKNFGVFSGLTPGALIVSAYIQTLLDDVDAATARTTLGTSLNPGNISQVLTDAAPVVWDTNLGAVASITPSVSRTFSAPTNLKAGGFYVLYYIQPVGGGTVPTFNAVFVGIEGAAVHAPAPGAGIRTTYKFVSDGTNLYLVSPASVAAIPRSYLAGCGISTAGASITMSISAGTAVDSTNVRAMLLAAIAKTTAAWAVGTAQGGLDTGAIAASTWYHFHVIQRTDTGVVDVLISLSASAPTMPANYTLFRRIGSGKTDGASQWTLFTQGGDSFAWNVLVADISANNPGIAAVSRTLTVPTGVNVFANIQSITQNAAAAVAPLTYISDLSQSDQAPTTALTDAPDSQSATGGVTRAAQRMQIRTNGSGQIRTRLSASDASVTLIINTLGWIDPRGRNS